MATKKQIQANRNNATKSTGPRTGEGKARVSQNALKHGLLARDAVLPDEDPAEFEPVGTHPDHRRRGLARALLLHGMRLARAAGATHMTVASLGAPGHPEARGLYYGVGFRKFTQDAPLLKTAG